MGTDDTNIRIKRDTWSRLSERKEPGKSFDDVIQELLDDSEARRTAHRSN